MRNDSGIQEELIELATKACPSEGMFRTTIPQLQIARANDTTEPTQTVYTPAVLRNLSKSN